MNKPSKKPFLVLVLIILLSLSLACNLSADNSADGAGSEPIPITNEAAEQLGDRIDAAAEAIARGEPFSIEITETQLTSAANLRLLALGENRVKDIQVYMRHGKMIIHGDLIQNGLTMPLNLEMQVNVNGQNQVGYEITTATVGPLPIPESVLDQFTGQLDQYLLGELYVSNIIMI